MKTFDSRIFFLRFLKSIGGMDFPMDFWLIWMCFINVLFNIITNLKFYKRCVIKDNLQKHFCILGGVLCVKEIHDCDLTVDSWQSLETCQNYPCELWLPSQYRSISTWGWGRACMGRLSIVISVEKFNGENDLWSWNKTHSTVKACL